MIINTHPNVYEPAEDSYLLINQLRKHELDNLNVCDMCCGTGTIGLHAVQLGAKVTCVDINQDAVSITQQNAQSNKLDTQVIQSDLFENVQGTFDIILCNPPYLPADKKDPADEITAALVGGKHGYELSIRCIQQAQQHLNPKGVLLMIVSSLAKPQVFEQHCLTHGYQYQVIASESMGGFETLYVYALTFLDGIKDAMHMGYTQLELHAKGKRGYVFRAKKDNVVCKIPYLHETLDQEAEMLQKVNKLAIGPKYIEHTAKCLVMEYIEGETLQTDWQNLGKQQKIDVFKQLLDQASTLEEYTINKKELLRPYKNMIVHNNKLTMLDFERARSGKPQNLTQLAQFVSYMTKVGLQEQAQLYAHAKMPRDEFVTLLFDTFKNNIS